METVGLWTFYFTSAIGGTVFVTLLFMWGMITGDFFEADFDFSDPDVDIDDGGTRLFSMYAFAAFFAVMGWTGVALTWEWGVSPWGAAPLAIIAGVSTYVVVLLVMAFLKKHLPSSGTMKRSNAVGKRGTVYATIPESGTGVVSVVVQGVERNLDAKSTGEQRIKTGDEIVVSGVEGTTLVVQPSNEK